VLAKGGLLPRLSASTTKESTQEEMVDKAAPWETVLPNFNTGAFPDLYVGKNETIACAIVRVIEEKCVDKARGKIYLPIKLWNRALRDKCGVKSFKVWSKVLGWLKAYFCIREVRKGENVSEIFASLTELKNAAERSNYFFFMARHCHSTSSKLIH
jgi:hypothetical protein